MSNYSMEWFKQELTRLQMEEQKIKNEMLKIELEEKKRLAEEEEEEDDEEWDWDGQKDRKSTRLNSSHT